jgi:hypothetical protein
MVASVLVEQKRTGEPFGEVSDSTGAEQNRSAEDDCTIALLCGPASQMQSDYLPAAEHHASVARHCAAGRSRSAHNRRL